MRSNGNQILSEEKRIGMKDRLENVFTEMLAILDFDQNDPQVKDTPKRMARMYVDDLFCGCYSEEPKITKFPNDQHKIHEDYPVFLGPISIKSMCSHHFLPFIGNCYISYIPGEQVVGISKLSRITNWFMRRPQIQEELSGQLCKYLSEKLNTKDVIVHIEASHMCMKIRGVREENSIMKTTSSTGNIFKQYSLRREFFEQINSVKKEIM